MGLMYSCRQAAALISRSLDEPLGRVDRLRLRLHLRLCGDCSNVERQLVELQRRSRGLFASEPPPAAGPDAAAPR